MSPTFLCHHVTLDVNSTAVDNDTLQRIVKQDLDMLNDTDVLPPELSTTAALRTALTTVKVTDVRTSVVTAARTIIAVPSTTFQLSKSRTGVSTTTFIANSRRSLRPIPSALTPLFASASRISIVLLPTASTDSLPTASTDISSTTSNLFPLTASASLGQVVEKGLPPGAFIGIAFSCMMLLLFPVIYFIRRRIRSSWITPFVVEKPVIRASVIQRQEKRREFFAESWQRILSSQRARRSREAVNADKLLSGRSNVASHRNGDGGHAFAPPSVYRGPSAGRPVQDALIVSSLFPNGAVAILRFEPRWQGELSVRPGDYLKVLTLFDDGWALCRNNRGQKGMVPTSCLRVNQAERMGQD